MRRIGVTVLAAVGAFGLALFGLARAGTETDPLAGGRVQSTTDVLDTGDVLLEPPPEGFVPWVSAEEARKAAAAFTGVPADAFEAPILALYSSGDRLVDAAGQPVGPLLHQDAPVWWLEVPSEYVLQLGEVWYADAGFDAEAALAEGMVGAGSVLVDACSGEAGRALFGVRTAERAGELAVEVSHDLGALSFTHEHRDPTCPTGHTWRPPWLTGASG